MLCTARLLLRPWQESDRQPFAAMSADPEVMRYLATPATPAAVDVWIERQIAHQVEHGFCFWAVEERASGTFVGTVGLLQVGYMAHFTPAVELGWRIARAFWGLGYAPEAALSSMQFGFKAQRLPEIVANACEANAKSRRVMEKLGMTHDLADDFDHPRIAEGHALRRQVLYRARPVSREGDTRA